MYAVVVRVNSIIICSKQKVLSKINRFQHLVSLCHTKDCIARVRPNKTIAERHKKPLESTFVFSLWTICRAFMLEGNSINSAYAWLGYPISIGCVEFKINTNEHFNTEFKATTNHFDSDPGHSVYSANAGVNVIHFGCVVRFPILTLALVNVNDDYICYKCQSPKSNPENYQFNQQFNVHINSLSQLHVKCLLI